MSRRTKKNSAQTVEEYLNEQLEGLIANLEEHAAQKMQKFTQEAKETRAELQKAVLSEVNSKQK